MAPTLSFIEIPNKQRIYEVRIEVNGCIHLPPFISKLDASLFPFGGESIIQWSVESSWKEKSSRSEKAIPVYLVFMPLDWWKSHASVLGSTHHHTKQSCPHHSDVSCSLLHLWAYGRPGPGPSEQSKHFVSWSKQISWHKEIRLW